MSSSFTPMIKQYINIKNKNKDAILFFRLGDFYEMFFEDAKEAAKILQITLTSREAGRGNKVPMCGIPYHAADNYIARLVRRGKRVAVCEQVENPAEAKGIVKREIVKVITPGTLVAQGLIENAVSSYVLALSIDSDDSKNFRKAGLAYADLSTGEFKITEIENKDNLFSEIYRISPAECLIPESLKHERLINELKRVCLGIFTDFEDWNFNYETSKRELINHFKVRTLLGFGCKDKDLSIKAAGALLKYLKQTQKSDVPNINSVSSYNISEYLELDSDSQRNLELFRNLYDQTKSGTLLEILDQARTPMGHRKLMNWIVRPLINVSKIKRRLDIVEIFLKKSDIRRNLRNNLKEIYDIERLSNRISLGSVNARDLIALLESLKLIPEIRKSLKLFPDLEIKKMYKKLDEMKDIVKLIESSIKKEPPVTIREGGIIEEGFCKKLDELRDIINGGKNWISNLQKKEIEKTNISSLKVGYNKVFGYYIEVTKPNLKRVPDDYIRKQTLVNSERFITPQLKKEESKILGAQEKAKSLEYELFIQVREKISKQLDRLQKISDIISNIDVFSNLAEIAVCNNYCKPEVNNDSVINIKDSRHPVLEKMMLDKDFVSNDIFLDSVNNRLLIITGPNMAGKSTYIRQVALIALMAQMGGFVPADKAKIGVVDKIFTRVGASDKLSQGMSTFMVEMVEAANILNNATSKSLIVLDEVGRGTSTFDGVSIAWAVAEYIHNQKKGARTLFATHYHELTELSLTCDGVKNYNFAVREWNEQVMFLYKLQEGGCDKSFGIHVARLAGLPKKVIERAKEILSNLELDSITSEGTPRFIKNEEDEYKKAKQKQLDFLSPAESKFIKEIDEINIDHLTPIEALNLLNKLKNKLKDTGYNGSS